MNSSRTKVRWTRHQISFLSLIVVSVAWRCDHLADKMAVYSVLLSSDPVYCMLLAWVTVRNMDVAAPSLRK